MLKELEYPFNAEYLIKKKKNILSHTKKPSRSKQEWLFSYN